MTHATRSLVCALLLALGLSAPARADLVIEGRAAQALHCSALLYIASDQLYQAGYLSRADLDWAQTAAVVMLDHVPGTPEQKAQAMHQRFAKIFARSSLPQLLNEFDKTAPWCAKTFL